MDREAKFLIPASLWYWGNTVPLMGKCYTSHNQRTQYSNKPSVEKIETIWKESKPELMSFSIHLLIVQTNNLGNIHAKPTEKIIVENAI